MSASEITAPEGESSKAVADRVDEARLRQHNRGALNAQLDREALDAIDVTPPAQDLLGAAFDELRLTGRGWDRVRRISRTIADLASCEEIDEPHMAEALALRGAW